MCSGGGKQTPKIPPVQPEAPSADRRETISTKKKANRRNNGTVLTAFRGIQSDVNTAGKTQLGA